MVYYMARLNIDDSFQSIVVLFCSVGICDNFNLFALWNVNGIECKSNCSDCVRAFFSTSVEKNELHANIHTHIHTSKKTTTTTTTKTETITIIDDDNRKRIDSTKWKSEKTTLNCMEMKQQP